MTSFNLVEERWVPVRTASGGSLASLREVLTEPERFNGLDADEVDEFFALLRLLTTIVNRALDGPRTPSEWAEIAYEDGYDREAISAYLTTWKHRFELFDPERPFLQYPELAGRKSQPMSVLLPSVSSGNGVTLFSHASEHDELVLSPAEAARALVHVVLNGRGSLKGGEYGVFGARVAVLGDNLRETILGNTPRYRGVADDGIPVWERAEGRALPHAPTKAEEIACGLMDLSTWQWRAVLLTASETGEVSACIYGHGPRPGGEEPLDPARWYDDAIEENSGSRKALRRDHRLRANRDIWREADALVAALARRDRPGVLSWNVDHRDAGEFQVLVGGPLVELKGSWVLTGMRSATLPVPSDLLRDDKLRGRVTAAIEHANATAKGLRAAVYVLARELVRPGPEAEPQKRRADDLASSLNAEPLFWAALPTAFERFLRAVANLEALREWKAAVDAEARRSLGEVISGLADSPRALKAAAIAQRHLSHRLSTPGATVLPAPTPSGAAA